MADQAIIGVDIGTGGVRAAIFSRAGKRLAMATVPSKLLRPEPGAVEENPQQQIHGVLQSIRQAMRESKLSPQDIAAIGIAGQMAGVIGVNASGQHVTPYDSWLDTRCAPQAREMEQAAGREIVERAGTAPGFNHGPKMLWWMQQRKSVYAEIRAFVQPAGYAAMRLCDLDAAHAFIDWTYLHFCAFADNPTLQWNEKLCAQFKFDARRLPRIVAPTQIIGHLSAAMARRCGLRAGIAVVAGCGDTAASFLAAGAAESGIAVDVAGTASVFAATTARFAPDQQHRTLACGRSSIRELWHPYAYIAGGGMNVDWAAKLLRISGDSNQALDELDRQARRIKLSDDLPMFSPHLSGRVCPHEPGLLGGWIGLTWNHQQAHLYRAVLEAVALEYALYRDILRAQHQSHAVAELRVVGGGGRSAYWNQLKADVLGSAVRLVTETEGSLRGAAMVAAVGIGLVPDLQTAARQWVRVGKPVQPVKSHASFYDARLKQYRLMLERLNFKGAALR